MQELREFSTIQVIAVMALPLVLAIVLHEIAHGYMAFLKGDNTAKLMGRLTLNPVRHIDPFGTVLMPLLFFYSTGMLFAFAKPVPVNFMNLHRPKEDMVWVAAAGPLINFILAVLSALALKVIGIFSSNVNLYIEFINQRLMPPEYSPIIFPLVGMFYFSVILNVVLAVINLIPIPPAYGGRIVVGLLPQRESDIYAGIESVGLILIIAVLMFNPFGITHGVIWPIIETIVGLLI
ncbi:MAG: site-2 protease family protein [Nitrospinota bacterium]|nr:site-2 protease family protein [Nitrospinota bacterium]